MAFKMEMLGRGPWQALTTLPNVIFSWFFLFYVGFGFCLADSVTTLERVGNKRTRTDSQTTPSPFNVTISQRNLCKTEKKNLIPSVVHHLEQPRRGITLERT